MEKARTHCVYRDNQGRATGRHCDYVNKEYDLEFKKPIDIKADDWYAMRFSREVNHPDYATKELARLMGYYLSEGCIFNEHGKTSGVQFCFNRNEYGYIEEVKKLLETFKKTNNRVIISNYRPEKNVTDVILRDKYLAYKLSFLCGQYAKTKKLHNSVLLWNPKIQLEMIGTYINGDGCCIKTEYHNGSIHMSSASKELIEQVYLMVLRSNVVSIIQKIERNRDREITPGHKIKDGIQYQINIGNYYSNKLDKVSSKIKEPQKSNFHKHLRFIYKDYLISRITDIKNIEEKQEVLKQ